VTIFKTDRPMLCYRTVVCPVCDVGVLWPKGWMDQDETWHGGRPRLRPHCVRWGPSSLSLKRAQPPIFRPCHCGQTIGWIKMPLGRKIGLGPGHTVLDGDQGPLPKGAQPPNFRPMSIVAKRSPISATAEHLFELNIR